MKRKLNMETGRNNVKDARDMENCQEKKIEKYLVNCYSQEVDHIFCFDCHFEIHCNE